MSLAAFIAGGLFALYVARAVGRWLRRFYWLAVAAVFGLGTLSVAYPLLDPSAGLGGAHRPFVAVSRALLRMVGDLFR